MNHPEPAAGKFSSLHPVLVAAAVALAYLNTFRAPMVLDDLPNILENPTIRSLWPPWAALFGQPGNATAGRPLINFSLALNWAVSGPEVWSYHLFNLAVHLLAAMALYAVARRIFLTPALHGAFGERAGLLALFSALAWSLHPLQTQAVTYVIQRYESMQGLFFLSSALAAMKGWERPGRGWHVLSVAAFFLGVLCKENMAVAPLCILALDAVLVRGGWRRALSASRGLYVGLLAGLVPWAALLASGHYLATLPPRPFYSLPDWLFTQGRVILHYLSLAAWPQTLVFDYGWPVLPAVESLPYALPVAALASASAWGLARRHPAGLAGACFFLLLAPTSSLVILMDAAFEYRIYLPLAPLVLLAAALAYLGAKRLPRAARPFCLALACALVLALGAGTHLRNRDYSSAVTLWSDTVQKRPDNPRARLNLGTDLAGQGRLEESSAQYREAIRLAPGDWLPYFNLANNLQAQGRIGEAVSLYRRAMALSPGSASVRTNLGAALLRLGEALEAERLLLSAVRLDPRSAVAWANLGLAMYSQGKKEEAEGCLARALAEDPSYIQAARLLEGIRKDLGENPEAGPLRPPGPVRDPAQRLRPPLYQVAIYEVI